MQIGGIVFDFDGTLIDSSERMYRLFDFLIPQNELAKDDYWELKRNKISHERLIRERYPNMSFKKFNEEWMRLIEDKQFLLYDKVFDDTKRTLLELSNVYDLFLLTARQKKLALQEELIEMELFQFFKQILVTEGNRTKTQTWNQFVTDISSAGKYIYVTDMGRDVLEAKELGFFTIGITHGFMSRECLLQYRPDYMIDNLNELLFLGV